LGTPINELGIAPFISEMPFTWWTFDPFREVGEEEIRCRR
jgi:hypothetical protein